MKARLFSPQMLTASPYFDGGIVAVNSFDLFYGRQGAVAALLADGYVFIYLKQRLGHTSDAYRFKLLSNKVELFLKISKFKARFFDL